MNNLLIESDPNVSVVGCQKPTVHNPFMNFNIITDPRKRPPGCLSYDRPDIKDQIEDKFGYNLYRNVSDLYGKSNSQREYYTMPSTTMPNDQTAYAKWLYNTGSTCKENTIKCAPETGAGFTSNMFVQSYTNYNN
jgi:hypothetical protein